MKTDNNITILEIIRAQSFISGSLFLFGGRFFRWNLSGRDFTMNTWQIGLGIDFFKLPVNAIGPDFNEP